MCSSPKAPAAPPPPPPPPASALKIGGQNVDDALAATARKKTGKSKLTVDLDSAPAGPTLTIPS